MKVTIDVFQDTLDGDYGPVEGIRVTCSRCGHEVEVFGAGEASIARAAATMRDDCPKDEKNFYEEGPFTEWPKHEN